MTVLGASSSGTSSRSSRELGTSSRTLRDSMTSSSSVRVRGVVGSEAKGLPVGKARSSNPSKGGRELVARSIAFWMYCWSRCGWVLSSSGRAFLHCWHVMAWLGLSC